MSAALVCRYRSVVPVRYWKPVQTAADQDDDTATVRRLAACRPVEIFDEGLRFAPPVSPHLAAQRTGLEIDLSQVAALVEAQPATYRWIVEGAGGVLTPLNGSDLMIDLIARLGLPAIVVSRTSLGTINHTLLTLEALRARSISIAGIVMVGPDNIENRRAIDDYGRAPNLGDMPVLTPLGPESLGRWASKKWLDPKEHLMEFLK